jgi:hypothetical protein
MSDDLRVQSLKDLAKLTSPSEDKSRVEIIGKLLVDARCHRIGAQARQALNEARDRATAWLSQDGGSFAAILLSEVLREYACEEFSSPERRRKRWKVLAAG